MDTDKQRNLSASNIDEVLFSERESVGEMVLNRPQALNALTQNMVLLMQDQLEKWSNDSRISMILIRGAPRGEKMVPFCSGGDLRSIYEHRNDPNKTFLTPKFREALTPSFFFKCPASSDDDFSQTCSSCIPRQRKF